MKKGFTLIELLIVVAIIAILAAIAVPNFLEAQIRSKVSRARSDMRSYATGIEAYYIDNNQYPLSARAGRLNGLPGNVNQFLPNAPANLSQICTYAARAAANTGTIGTLTTPISYITSYFPDPFVDTRGATFGYYSDSNGWILWSCGPDTDQSKTTELGNAYAVETIYTSQQSQPTVLLITGSNGGLCFTYDPTNGTVSPGDVWRVKQ